MPEPQLGWASDYLGVDVAWQLLPGSNSSNRLYQARVGTRDLVLRINAGQALAFGVDREREARVLLTLAGAPWAPVVLHNDWQQGWCLMANAGRSLAAGPLPSALAQQLMTAVSQWQQLPLAAAALRMDYAALWQRYREMLTAAVDGRCPPPAGSVVTIIELLDRSWQVLQQLPSVPEALVHHDLHAGNLCQSGGQLRVLDWEYAGFGSPWLDGAALQRQFAIPVAAIGGLTAFKAVSPAQLRSGLSRADWLNASLELLWHSVRSLQEETADLTVLARQASQLLSGMAALESALP